MDWGQGDLYGQIVSGYPDARKAYIIPAVHIFEEIAELLGPVRLSTALSRPTTTGVAENPLIEKISPSQIRHQKTAGNKTRSLSGSGLVESASRTSSSIGSFTSTLSNTNIVLGEDLVDSCPPLNATELLCSLQTSEGQIIRPKIFGRIDKGFFMADNDWTCYRRNYFEVTCSYTFLPTLPPGAIYISQGDHKTAQVYCFAM